MRDIMEFALKILMNAASEETKEKGAGCDGRSCEGLVCTRPKEHSGPHIAMGTEYICKVWFQNEKGYQKGALENGE